MNLQIERWWCGGGAQGPSEYAAHFRPTSALRPWMDIGTTMRLSPSLLRPPTLEHFAVSIIITILIFYIKSKWIKRYIKRK
jgi:hypothetical protein